MSQTAIFAFNKKVIDAQAMTGSISSSSIEISEVVGFAVHSIWTGAPVGNIVTTASNDDLNYVTIDTHAAGGAAGQYMLNVPSAHYRYVKVTYSFTSGTGSLTSYCSGKTN